MEQFIKGADVSTIIEVETCGGRFFDKYGNEKELLSLLKDHGFNYVRIRLWNDPYSEKGEPYGAGTNDLATLLQIAKRAKALSLGILLDFHYSDFWADPGKQNKPKAWKELPYEQLVLAVHDFTKDVLNKMQAEGVYPEMIQIGNELSSGLLWPDGRWPEFKHMAELVSSGIKAVRECDKAFSHTSLVMIHLDNGGKNELYRTWFDNYFKYGEDFDIIGLSYYPFWHGTLDDLKNNMQDISSRYHKDLIVAEVSMGFSLENYAEYEGLSDSERKGYATKPALCERVPYPMTGEGQKAFFKDFLKVISEIKDDRGCGFFWWEAGWLPVKGSGWATYAALDYTKEKGPLGNEWANQALFDYDGRPLPILDLINEFMR